MSQPKLNPEMLEFEYMQFIRVDWAGKTKKYRILNKRSGSLLGGIAWYGPWRQYCLHTLPGIVFNRGCLQDINTFIDMLMDERKVANARN